MSKKTTKSADVFRLASPDWEDYALLDTGGGAKLERFGPYVIVRPEPRAIWQPRLPRDEWDKAAAVFYLPRPTDDDEKGRWDFRQPIPERWEMHYKDLKFWAMATPFRHLGVFPEQAAHWDWLRQLIRTARRPVNVLNLFAYTGVATLAAAAAGASVTHLDASPKAVQWGRDNQELSGLGQQSIRWIVDDALKFVQREARRGVRYDGFIMDPPPYGHGPKGEAWVFEKSLPVLMDACREMLTNQPLFAVLTAYTPKTSVRDLKYALETLFRGRGGTYTAGEAILVERSGVDFLSAAMFARWEASNKT